MRKGRKVTESRPSKDFDRKKIVKEFKEGEKKGFSKPTKKRREPREKRNQKNQLLPKGAREWGESDRSVPPSTSRPGGELRRKQGKEKKILKTVPASCTHGGEGTKSKRSARCISEKLIKEHFGPKTRRKGEMS